VAGVEGEVARGIRSAPPHLGHLTDCPASSSLAMNCAPHEHATLIPIASLPFQACGKHHYGRTTTSVIATIFERVLCDVKLRSTADSATLITTEHFGSLCRRMSEIWHNASQRSISILCWLAPVATGQCTYFTLQSRATLSSEVNCFRIGLRSQTRFGRIR
jgi:hypothetical protein